VAARLRRGFGGQAGPGGNPMRAGPGLLSFDALKSLLCRGGAGLCSKPDVAAPSRRPSMPKPTLKQIAIVDVSFGRNVTVIEPANLYGCTIGDDSFVGPFVEIQRNAVIGRRCRVQSHKFICELVTMGDDCFVGHGVMFINDLFQEGRPAGNRALWKATTIGARVSIGSNATILPVSICDDVVIGAGAVVTRDITKPGIYAGNPARLLRRLPKK
jgi:acetyltransferase-like isoleucine patch superfamily enzyme